MDVRSTLQSFAANFVLPDFRERFVHEAIRQPGKLHARICHQIEAVFPTQYKDQTVSFEPDGPCLMLGWTPDLPVLTWAEASARIGLGGLLVIDGLAKRFYAETEGEPKIHKWAGEGSPDHARLIIGAGCRR